MEAERHVSGFVSLAVGLSVLFIGQMPIAAIAADSMVMIKTNGKDFDASGNFVNYGKGTKYASSWAQLSGHGYFASPDELSLDYGCVIPNGKTLRTPQSSSTLGKFPGSSLTVEPGGSIIVYCYNKAALDFGDNPGLVYSSGNDFANYIGGKTNTARSASQTYIDGKVTFDYPGVTKFTSANNLNVGYTFRGKVVTDAETTLCIDGSYTFTENRAHFFSTEFLGDTTGIAGAIEVNSNSVLAVGQGGLANAKQIVVKSCIYPDQLDHAGTIRASAWDTQCDISSLVLESHAAIEVPVDMESGSNGIIRVTKGVDVAGAVTVYLSNAVGSKGYGRHAVLTRATTASGVISKDDYVFGGLLDGGYCLGEFSVGPNDDGEETLYLTIRPVVTAVLDSTSGNTASTAYFCQNTNAEAWSDHKLPHGYADYYAGVKYLRFPLDTNTDYVFPGNSLTIAKDCKFYEAYKTFTCTNLIMLSGSTCLMWNYSPRTIYGKITVSPDDPNGLVKFDTYQNRVETFAADMFGQGIVQFQADSGSGTPNGTVILKGDNSGYLGRIDVTLDENKSKGYPSETYFETLKASSALQLGGNLMSFAYNALSLRNYALFVVTDDILLKKASNRGLYAELVGRVEVAEEKTFSVECGLTLNGELRKSGNGTLALGGVAGFGDSGDSAPIEDKNLLKIDAGAFKPLSSECVNGVALAFAAGTKLTFELCPEDQGLAAHGLKLTRTGGSFVISGDMLPIFFSCDDVTKIPGTGVEVALFTGSQEICESIRSKIQLQKPMRGFRAELMPTGDNGDGTFSLKAFVGRCGLLMTVR